MRTLLLAWSAFLLSTVLIAGCDGSPSDEDCDGRGEPCTAASCCEDLVCEVSISADGETSECR